MPVDERDRRWANRVRSQADLERLSAFDEMWALPLVLGAVIPIALSLADVQGPLEVAISTAAWLVFVVDLAVHIWLIRGYLRTRLGLFDLAVVIATAPIFYLLGLESSRVLLVARLVRLARVFFLSTHARRLLHRLGRVTAVAVVVLVTCALIAYDAEHDTNRGFATFADALWWGVVTLTTVGYGDVVPRTAAGQIAGVALMIMGVALLGLLAGTLASFFRLTPHAGHHQNPAEVHRLTTEIEALRAQVAELARRLPPAPNDDAPATDP